MQTPKVCGVTILQKSHTWCKLHTAVDTFMYIQWCGYHNLCMVNTYNCLFIIEILCMYILSLIRLYNFIYFVLDIIDILLDELEQEYAEQVYYIIGLYTILM